MLKDWLGYSVRRRLLDADLEELSSRMDGNVIEIGCGRSGRRGRFSPPIEKANTWTFVDVQREVDPMVVAEIGSLPFRNDVFDVAVCLEVLEYVLCPENALRELSRVLKPNGILIMSTPFLHRYDTSSDCWRYTENGFRRLMEGAGFEVESLRQQGAALAVAANILKYSVSKIPSGLMRRPVTVATYPFLSMLLNIDSFTASRMPALQTFSTGYLAVATKSSEAVKSC